MKRFLIISAIIIGLLAGLGLQAYFIHSLRGELANEKSIHRQNLSALMLDMESYRVNDSLSAAKVNSLTLTIDEYERYRQKDLETIKNLRTKKNDLEGVIKAQTETIVSLSTQIEKREIQGDSARFEGDSTILFAFKDKWCDVQGKIEADSAFCDIRMRDSLMIVKSVKYSKCIVKKWRKVKSVEYDIVSFNPHTTISGFGVVEIEKK